MQRCFAFDIDFGVCRAAAGPAAELRPLLDELLGNGVFVRELDTNGNAFHSPMLAPTLPQLRACEPPCLYCPTSRSK